MLTKSIIVNKVINIQGKQDKRITILPKVPINIVIVQY